MGRRDVSENEFANFERFLDAWSRRDFLRGMGGSLAVTTFLAGGMELLAACGGNSGSRGTSTQNANAAATSSRATLPDVANLNPLYINDVYSQTIAYRLYDALLSVDDQANLVPNLATDVPKVSSDGLSYTFKLHKGVQWSDGQPLTADRRGLHLPAHARPRVEGRTRPATGPRPSSTYRASPAADPQTVVINTTKVFAPFLASLSALAPAEPGESYPSTCGRS